ncbi:MAG: succinoglycan biosynthesis protein ExoI [Rhodospirillaceae bacterium]|nr:MAG: succinoglycan biosynthesis protein ExoI [Rhodospirillaceae bacterium]
MKFGLIMLSALLASVSASAQNVIDGDTLYVNGQPFSIFGIDAPEKVQWCGDYPAGELSTRALEKLVHGGNVICEARGTDRYLRTLAVCRLDGVDLGKTMVRLGMAWAFTRYSQDYVDQEALAREERLGVHAHDCVPAWDWRAGRRN